MPKKEIMSMIIKLFMNTIISSSSGLRLPENKIFLYIFQK